MQIKPVVKDYLTTKKRNNMEEVCGYVDKAGKFHKTESACKKANIDLEIEEVKRFLQNLEWDFRTRLLESSSKYILSDLHFDDLSITEIEALKEWALSVLCEEVLKEEDGIKYVIEEKEKFSDRLDELRKEKSAIKENEWWLYFKWW